MTILRNTSQIDKDHIQWYYIMLTEYIKVPQRMLFASQCMLFKNNEPG